jgi:hypothetical protein
MLRCQYQVTDRVMSVPYPGRRRSNRGFADLRGRPIEAAAIPEAAGSPALTILLQARQLPMHRYFQSAALRAITARSTSSLRMSAADMCSWRDKLTPPPT